MNSPYPECHILKILKEYFNFTQFFSNKELCISARKIFGLLKSLVVTDLIKSCDFQKLNSDRCYVGLLSMLDVWSKVSITLWFLNKKNENIIPSKDKSLSDIEQFNRCLLSMGYED